MTLTTTRLGPVHRHRPGDTTCIPHVCKLTHINSGDDHFERNER